MAAVAAGVHPHPRRIKYSYVTIATASLLRKARRRCDRGYIVLEKAAAYFGIYFVMAVYAFTIVTRGFALPQPGDLATLTTFVTPFLLACIFPAMVLSSLVWRREDCILLFVCLSVPLLFLSGVSWPWPSIPAFRKGVACLFPSTFGMNGYVQSTGAALSDVAFELRGLWIQTGVYFTIACLIYRRQIAALANRRRK